MSCSATKRARIFVKWCGKYIVAIYSKQEAEEAYKNVTEEGAFASISFGTPEHYETVKINYEEEI